jgi:hypothetical protein
MKNFLVKIYAYKYKMELQITCMDGPLDIENAIVDKLGKGDIKWEYLGEMNDPKINRITYEEVINGGDDATSTRPIHEEKGSGSRVGAGAS